MLPEQRAFRLPSILGWVVNLVRFHPNSLSDFLGIVLVIMMKRKKEKKRERKLMMIFFLIDWCILCHRNDCSFRFSSSIACYGLEYE